MHQPSAARLARQSEAMGQEAAPGELARLGRRHFLKSGALTVAGIATLSGVEIVRSPFALAQDQLTVLSPVSNFQINNASATPVPGHPTLHVCKHFTQFDFASGPSDPPGGITEIPRIYRLNEGAAYPANVPGGLPADRLQPVLQPAPWQSLAAAPADPYPTLPGQPPTGTPVNPQDLLPVVCYRLVQKTGQNTFRVYDWCAFYCYPANFVALTAIDKCLCYRVGSVGQPPPQPQKSVVNDAPQFTDFWAAIRSGAPHSIGGIYYYTYNSQQGAFSTATWNATLNVPQGTQCKVEAYIPGSSAPQNRTARAKYQVSNIGIVGVSEVVISHQLAQSQWVTLGTFPFREGSFSVRLLDETGEPRGSRIVVADAVRWTTP
jgi:hypothetical protein